MRTFTVTIGRNVGSEPMEQSQWNDFVWETRTVCESVSPELWANAAHRNSWNGISEDSFILYGPLVDNDDSTVEFLRNRLDTLATKYRQDAIGLSIGESELRESFTTAAPVHSTV
jgi:hypothetical protein